MYENIILN